MKKAVNFIIMLMPSVATLALNVLVSALTGIFKLKEYLKIVPNFTQMTITTFFMSLSYDKEYLLSATMIYQAVALCFFFIWYKFIIREKIEWPHKTFTPVSVIGLIVMVTGIEMLCTYLLLGASAVFPKPMEEYAKMIERMGVTDLTFLSAFVSLVLAPIGEELAFRGVTFKYARRLSDKFWVANILQAALFGIYHLNIVQGTYAFLLGMVLGYVVKRYNSLWASIICHLGFNFAGTFLVEWIFGKEENILVIKLILVFVVAAALAITGLMTIKKDKKGDEREEMFNKRVAMEWPERRILALNGVGLQATNIENTSNDEGSSAENETQE